MSRAARGSSTFVAWIAAFGLSYSLSVQAGEGSAGRGALQDAQTLYRSGQYFKAARYAFQAKELSPELAGESYSWVTLGLIHARLYHSAAYFFVKTLQSGDQLATRRVLTELQELLVRVGPDLLRKYLVRHTRYEDYDSVNRSAYLYALAKEALLSHQEEKAIGYVSGISPQSPFWPYALQLRASAQAVLGRGERALQDFRQCQDRADGMIPSGRGDANLLQRLTRESKDLAARCQAGEARTYYEMDRFDEADQAYDHIAKSSIVWPDALFEQGWNAFARQEYNRTLGKLVSYKSPALKFVFNPEVEVLRAQSFLALCLYDDVNQSINDFNSRYAQLGERVKRFIEQNTSNLPGFYEYGKQVLNTSIYASDEVSRMANRFVRGPYFQGLVSAERAASLELQAIQQFNALQPGADPDLHHGFPGFLEQVISWRLKSIRNLGGAFVKNSFMDYHTELLANFDKISFIKLEMLKRAKDQLVYKNRIATDRGRGNVEPSRRNYQYFWSFNGEFWNDELGDYVFGLESECRGQNGA